MRKKIFVSMLLIFGLVASTASAFAADNTRLDQNFNYDANDTTIGTVGAANKYNIYTHSITKGTIDIAKVDETNGALKIAYPGEAAVDNTAKVGIRNGTIFSPTDSRSVVIKTRMNFSQQNEKTITLYFGANSLGTGVSAQTYKLIVLRFNNTQYQLGTSAAKVDNTTIVSMNAWHDYTFVLQDNGALVDGKSPDKIYTYIDNKLFYAESFGDGHDFNGRIDELDYNLTKGKNSAAGSWTIDNISTSVYNGGTAEVATKEVFAGDVFEHNPTITPTDSAYDLSISGYKVIIDSAAPLSFNAQTNKFEALEVEADTDVTVKYDFYDELITDSTVTFKVKKNVSSILPTDIEQKVFSNDITLNIGQSFALNDMFIAIPALATNKELEFSNVGSNGAFEITDGRLTGIAPGEGQLKVVAKGDTSVTKTIKVIVNGGNFDDLNNMEVNDSWLTDGTELRGFKSVGYSGKTFSPISTVADPLMGKAIKFTGIGGTNNGGSHLDKYIDATALEANKDYKLSGWVKMDNFDLKTSVARVDVKLFAYYQQGENFIFPAQYQTTLQLQKNSIQNNGWIFFETEAVNLDTSRAVNGLTGIKVEIASYNNEAGIDSYVSNLALVQQDSVKVKEYSLTVDDVTLTNNQAINKKINTNFTIGNVCLPSAGTVNLSFSSSNDALATVDSNGVVTIKGLEGQVIITATDGTTSKTIVVNIINPLTEIALESSEIDFVISDSAKELVITKNPVGSLEGLEVIVSNNQVCTATIVNGKLVITPVGLGQATIKVQSTINSAVFAQVTVNVTDVEVTNIEVTKNEVVVGDNLKLGLGVKFSFTYAVKPITRVDKTVVVAVGSQGIIAYNAETKEFEVLKVGTTTITLTCGEFSKVITVTIVDESVVKATSLSVGDDKVSLKIGAEHSILASVNPNGYTSKIIYTSSDDKIIKVDANGKVTAISSGEATITVSIDGLSAVVTVNVSKKTNVLAIVIPCIASAIVLGGVAFFLLKKKK